MMMMMMMTMMTMEMEMGTRGENIINASDGDGLSCAHVEGDNLVP
jgi:hypothetical protein